MLTAFLAIINADDQFGNTVIADIVITIRQGIFYASKASADFWTDLGNIILVFIVPFIFTIKIVIVCESIFNMSLKLRNMPFPVKTLLPLYGYLPDLIRIVALIDYFSKKECQLCLHGWQTRHLQLQCQETQRQAPQTAVFFFLNCSIITSQFGHLPFSFNGLPHFPQNFDIINSPASQN